MTLSVTIPCHISVSLPIHYHIIISCFSRPFCTVPSPLPRPQAHRPYFALRMRRTVTRKVNRKKQVMATYEDRYRSLGYLFYSIAWCDRNLIQAEIDSLKRMVKEHWLVVDRNYDELGIESAQYIEVTFDHAMDIRMPAKEAYQIFETAQTEEPDRFDKKTRELILLSALAIAAASGSVNRSEAACINELTELLQLEH